MRTGSPDSQLHAWKAPKPTGQPVYRHTTVPPTLDGPEEGSGGRSCGRSSSVFQVGRAGTHSIPFSQPRMKESHPRLRDNDNTRTVQGCDMHRSQQFKTGWRGLLPCFLSDQYCPVETASILMYGSVRQSGTDPHTCRRSLWISTVMLYDRYLHIYRRDTVVSAIPILV